MATLCSPAPSHRGPTRHLRTVRVGPLAEHPRRSAGRDLCSGSRSSRSHTHSRTSYTGRDFRSSGGCPHPSDRTPSRIPNRRGSRGSSGAREGIRRTGARIGDRDSLRNNPNRRNSQDRSSCDSWDRSSCIGRGRRTSRSRCSPSTDRGTRYRTRNPRSNRTAPLASPHRGCRRLARRRNRSRNTVQPPRRDAKRGRSRVSEPFRSACARVPPWKISLPYRARTVPRTRSPEIPLYKLGPAGSAAKAGARCPRRRTSGNPV